MLPNQTDTAGAVPAGRSAARSRRRLLALAAAALVAATPQHGAGRNRRRTRKRRPAVRLAAACPALGTSSGGNILRQAQTFVLDRGGRLVKASFDLMESPEGAALTVEIRRTAGSGGAPGDDVIASTTFTDLPENGSATPRTLTAVFSNPPLVEAGERFALVVTGRPNQSFSLRTRFLDACGGSRFIDRGEGFEEAGGTADLVFAVFVRS